MLCVTGWKVTVNPLVTTAATSAAMVLADFAGHRREKPMLVVVIKGPTRGMAALAFMEVGVQGEGTIFVGVALEVSIERWITVGYGSDSRKHAIVPRAPNADSRGPQ
jgi:hypothetical protein